MSAAARKPKDSGTTQIFGSEDIRKSSLRVTLLGDLDELGSVIGVARATVADAALDGILARIQSRLLAIGAAVADPRERHDVGIVQEEADVIDKATQRLVDSLPKLVNFILPGGGQGAATLHLARSVCRRAERSAHTLGSAEPLPVAVPEFLNELSTYLFHLARRQSIQSSHGDDVWTESDPLKPGELDLDPS